MTSISPLSLDVSFKQYEDDMPTSRHQSENAETATTCSSVSGDDDIEAGNGMRSTLTSDLDSSYSSRCDTVSASRGRPQLPRAARRSFLMYGDAPRNKRDSVISLPTHVESKDDGETFQPAKSLMGRSSISDIPVHKPARPGIIKSVSRLSMSSRSAPFGSNHYTESIRLVQKQHPSSGKNTLPNYDFLTPEKKSKDEGSLLPKTKWWHGIFFFSLIALVACVVTLWAPYPFGARMPSEMIAQMPWSNGCKDLSSCICPRETICADDLMGMILLTISRCSAWFDYPLYMCLFLSKCNNLNNFLQKTVLRCWINFSDYHKVHRIFGIIVGIESLSHSAFHMWRWARRNDDIKLLWTSQTGITGMIVLILSLLIILPMTLPYLKRVMSYEWRKGLHYLSIFWAVGLMCHAPQRIFWMMGVPLALYLIDKAVEIFSRWVLVLIVLVYPTFCCPQIPNLPRTFLLESTHFERLSDSICVITFENPPGFGKANSAYVYLMLPWISRFQFHAFTVFPGNKPNTSSICINKCGDWTQALLKEIETPTHKPAFIMGPYLSPFSSPAMDSENLVAVASGIGVTPAWSLIRQYSSTSRKMNLIWICRDAALVEHFLQSLEIANGNLLIYYTGKRPLYLNNDLPPNVSLFNGRPDLEKTISGVIFSTATDSGLPEEVYNNNSFVQKSTPELSVKLLLEKALSVYSLDQLFESAVRASTSVDEDLPQIKSAASFKGVLLMMKHLLGSDCDLMLEKILRCLDVADSYGSSVLTRDMFEDFISLMREDDEKNTLVEKKRDVDSLDVSRVPLSSVNDALSHGMYGVKKILNGEGKYSSKKWSMLYCGGSEPVLSQLRKYKRKYSIGLSVEKFDW